MENVSKKETTFNDAVKSIHDVGTSLYGSAGFSRISLSIVQENEITFDLLKQLSASSGLSGPRGASIVAFLQDGLSEKDIERLCMIIAHLKTVDTVIVCTEEELPSFIEELKPNAIVKKKERVVSCDCLIVDC